jgi:uncharacterized protein (TIGR02231 family)
MKSPIQMKKTLVAMLLILNSSLLFSQERIRINNTEIKEVKIYQNGALVTRTGKALVSTGNQEVVFDGLSPYINPQSITVKGLGDATILSVNYQQNYLTANRKTKEQLTLEDQRDSVQYKLSLVNNRIAVLNETVSVLQANKSIGGNNNGVMADELEPVVEYFAKKMTSLKDEILDNSIRQKKLQEQISKIDNQLNEINVRNNQPEGNIIVTVDGKSKSQATFEFSYLIESNVNWQPFYDLRVKDVKSPVEIVFKAKVNQSTGEDWKNVALTLNTGNPSQSGDKPVLYPWVVGFLQPITQIRGARIDGYATNAMAGGAPAMMMEKDANAEQKVMMWDMATVTQNQLNVAYEIPGHYTLLNGSNETQVEIQHYTTNANYEYVAVPKIDNDAFLTAQITEWENLNLSPGQANVYFDGAYVGQSYINPAETNDTLTLSLGRDQRITFKREKVKELTSSKLFGSNKEKSFAYELTIRNTKKEPITIIVEDQVPLSQEKDIEIKVTELSGGIQFTGSGIVKWKITLQPGESTKKTLSYSIKYPKDKQLSGL